MGKAYQKCICFSCGRLRNGKNPCQYCGDDIEFSLRNDSIKCQRCGERIGPTRVMCPYCKFDLTQPCENCGVPVQRAWPLCPLCGAIRVNMPALLKPPKKKKKYRTLQICVPTVMFLIAAVIWSMRIGLL